MFRQDQLFVFTNVHVFCAPGSLGFLYLGMFMSVLYSVMISFLYLSILVMLVKCLLCILICECIWLFLSSSVMCLFFDTLYFSFFVFFNFSNILQVHLNLQDYWFVFVFIAEALLRFLYLLGKKDFLFIGSFRRESFSRWYTLKHGVG